MDFKKSPRQLAISSGAMTYASQFPCKANGHVGERYTSTGRCVQCARREVTGHQFTRYSLERAMRPKAMTADQVLGLNLYVLQCIDTYCEHLGLPAPRVK